MDHDNTKDVNQINNYEPETSKITSLPSKSIIKVVKNFMKCIGTLIQHVENAISYSNGIVITNLETIVSNDGNEIDIEEHSIKQEPNDTKKNLKNVKKCILKLCLLCIEKNIFIECDIKFTEIAFYSCLDESTRSLVLDYLTENVAYTIDHIHFIIEIFNHEKGENEAKDISKSLKKLYKQILLIPLNSNLDETPPAFKNLNTSQWYSEARNNLAEKLNLLRTYLIKLRKTLKKKIPNPETITIEDTDVSNDGVKRKNNAEDKQTGKKLKLDQHVFQIPKSPDKNNKSVILSDNDSNKSKKKRKNKESDTESVNSKEEQKEIIKNEQNSNSDSEVITELLFDESDEEVKNNLREKIKQNGETSGKDNSSKRKKSDSESSSKENKFSLNNSQEQNSVNKFRSLSVCSDMTIENLFTSELSINEESLIVPQSLNKTNKKTKSKEEKRNIKIEKVRNIKTKKKSKSERGLIQLTLDDLAKNLKSTRRKETKSPTKDDVDLDISHGIFSGLSSGDLEVEVNEEHDKLLQKLIKENELNSKSKFLYLQQLVRESEAKEKLSKEMKQKLRNLYIKINWKIPESHKIESRISGPSPPVAKALKALKVTDKKYNKVEDETIKRNWREFCHAHGLDENPTPFLSLRHGRKSFLLKEERIKFAQFLAKDLPFRGLHSVYRRFRHIFKPSKYGRYSAVEDELILTYCSHRDSSQQRFSDLATVLQRPRYSLERRYRILTNPLMVTRVKWNLELETEVVNSLLKLMNSKNVQDLQNTTIPKDYFKKIGKAMGIDYNKVEIHYLKFIYPKLFSPNILHAGEIRVKLVKLLIETGETDWKNINWNEIIKHFSGVTRTFLLGQIFGAVHTVVPKKYIKNLAKSIKYLKKYIEESESLGQQPFSKKIIKRYCMTENGLETID